MVDIQVGLVVDIQVAVVALDNRAVGHIQVEVDSRAVVDSQVVVHFRVVVAQLASQSTPEVEALPFQISNLAVN